MCVTLNQLRREIIWRADTGLREIARVVHLPRDPEIAELDEIAFRQEDV